MLYKNGTFITEILYKKGTKNDLHQFADFFKISLAVMVEIAN